MNGTLVLGQDQDSLGENFGQKQSWIGKITLLNLWDSALPSDQVKILINLSFRIKITLLISILKHIFNILVNILYYYNLFGTN